MDGYYKVKIVADKENDFSREDDDNWKRRRLFISPAFTYDYYLGVDEDVADVPEEAVSDFKNMSFCINVGYFLFKNFAVTACVGINEFISPEYYSTWDHYYYENEKISFAFGFGVKYYLKHFFCGVDILATYNDVDPYLLEYIIGMAEFQVGYAFPLTKRLALETSCGYTYQYDASLLAGRIGLFYSLKNFRLFTK